MPRAPLYRHYDGALLLRAGTHVEDRTPSSDPAEGIPWLSSAWADPGVRDAVQAANPELYERVETVLFNESGTERTVNKLVTSLLGYLARSRRPTPFGLFAGVAPVSLTDHAAVDQGVEHHLHTRADHDWIGEVIDRLHACPDLMERVSVVAHNVAVTRGERLVVPGPPAKGRRAAPVEVTARLTPAVSAVMEAARTPTPYGELLARLEESFPDAPKNRITTLVDGMLDQGFLISGLWAPTTTSDALAHLCEVLERMDARDVTAVSELVEQVLSLHERLAAPATLAQWAAKAPLRQELARIADATPVPLTVDTTLDCRVDLPFHVVSAFERAADVLARTSAHPFGTPIWREYHHRFRERYGPGATVPLLEVIADSGIGWPAGYLGADRLTPATTLTDRDTVLLERTQRAMAEGGELVLTDELIALLGRTGDAEIVPPDRVELAARLHSPDLETLEREEFSLWVTAAPRPGSSMFGRFLGLLPEADRDPLRGSFTTNITDAVVAQVSFHARRRRNDQLIRTPRVAPLVISLGEHRPQEEGVIGLEDLAVVADSTGFGLIRVSTGQRVITRVAHPLEPQNQTPPLARFLAEIPIARSAFYGAFDLGAAARSAHVPRIRYGNVVLSPARWTLTSQDVAGRAAARREWDGDLQRWRDRWKVPDHVAVVEHDRRLPLDLGTAAHRHLLRRHLETHDQGRIRLCEEPAPEQVGWIGRPHELVVALHNTDSTSPTLPRAHVTSTGEESDTVLPGGAPVHARFTVHPERAEHLLIDHLPDLIDRTTCTRWWFRLTRDTARVDSATYLDITLRPEAERTSATIAALHAWAERVHRDGLIPGMALTPYHPQHARYGKGEAAYAAEAVFTADSVAALAQRRSVSALGVDSTALTAASFADLSAGLLGTRENTEEGDRWLLHDLTHTPGPVPPTVRNQSLAWARLGPGEKDDLWNSGKGLSLSRAWKERGRALENYRATLRRGGQEPTTVLRSLLHLHHVRARGVEPEGEAVTLRAARAIALARTHHRP